MSKEDKIITSTGVLEMEVSPFFEQLLKGSPFFLEIEMLQGERQELENGLIKYRIEIHGTDKSQLIMEFCLKMISQSHNACKS